MELEAFNIEFDYIKGSNNVLADTMSRLVNIDPDTQQHPEEPRYEFGYAVFEEIPEVKTNTYEVNEVIVGTQKEIKNDPDLQGTLQCIKNPIALERLKRLQKQDAHIESLKHKLKIINWTESTTAWMNRNSSQGRWWMEVMNFMLFIYHPC